MAKEYGNNIMSFNIDNKLKNNLVINKELFELLLFNLLVNSIENTRDGFIFLKMKLEDVNIKHNLSIEIYDNSRSFDEKKLILLEKDDSQLTISTLDHID